MSENRLVERIALTGDRLLLVRQVAPADAAALSVLYDGLDDEDRYRRFFGGYRPPPEFFQRLASVPSGGARLVAELIDHGAATIVGEAGYVPLPNGNGELAIAVSKPWRGWLGSYLLGRLRQIAARRGVPNLEADVLIANRAMLAVLRSMGCVFIGHDGWNVVRLMIGTDGVPSWPDEHTRPCVLVEAARGQWDLEDDARAAGIDVVTCRGPASNRACPVLQGRPCPLSAEADAVIVRKFEADEESWDPVIEANRRLSPDVQVWVDSPQDRTSPGTVDQLFDLLGRHEREHDL